jgi:cyclopropane fatty-acyl-phospholipid synthase-like methyltransferase
MSKKFNSSDLSSDKTYRLYSKSSSFYKDTHKNFFKDNNLLFQKALAQNELYIRQPRRKVCKLCRTPLPTNRDFHSHKVDYVFCGQCSHLNGSFDDTEAFFNKIYLEGDGSIYSEHYIDANFSARVENIYRPKAEFLASSLPSGEHKVLDLGCGSGYFVCALLLKGIEAVGLDVNKTMIEYGNSQISQYLDKEPLEHRAEAQLFNSVSNSDADVISAIGVIEHLRNPYEFFSAFQKSRARYLFYCVPMFSLSTILENAFQDIFPRQLSGDHTHLFTERSIKELNSIVGVRSLAEWRFGTDALDLYRHLIENLKSNNSSSKMIELVNKELTESIDEIQSIFDKNHFCSEIHLLAAKY